MSICTDTCIDSQKVTWQFGHLNTFIVQHLSGHISWTVLMFDVGFVCGEKTKRVLNANVTSNWIVSCDFKHLFVRVLFFLVMQSRPCRPR